MESQTERVGHHIIPDSLRENLGRRSMREEATQTILENYGENLGEVVDWIADPASHLRPGDMSGLLTKLDSDRIDAIAELLLDDNLVVAQRATEAMATIGGKSVPVIVKILNSGHPDATARAKNAIMRMGDAAVPELRRLAKDEDASAAVIFLLAAHDPDAVEHLEDIIAEALRSPDQLKARFAIDAVLSVGDRLTDILLELIGSSDPFAQQNATNALIELGEIAVPELVDELDHPNPVVQQNAMRALREIGAPAIDHLNAAMKGGSSLQQQNALAVLKTIKVSARGKGGSGNKSRNWFRR